MNVAIVRFPLPQGMSLEEAKEIFEQSVPVFHSARGLVRKYDLYGAEIGGGVYLWRSREDGERFYSPAWHKMMTVSFGSKPEIDWYDAPVIVENPANNFVIRAA